MREAFEEYQKEESYRDDDDLVIMENGEYYRLEVQWDWQLWQAAWEACRNDNN